MLKNNKKQITSCLIFVKQKIICFLANLHTLFHLPQLVGACWSLLELVGACWSLFINFNLFLFLSNKILKI
jgi:hypothetical protein